MVFAVVYADDASVVATYASEEEATRKLSEFVAANPTLQDEVGLRPYEDGRPAGPWTSASEVLGDKIAQPHLV